MTALLSPIQMDDDEFDYGDSYEQSMQQSAEDNRNNIPTDTMRVGSICTAGVEVYHTIAFPVQSTAVANQHYDEAVELSSEGSVDQRYGNTVNATCCPLPVYPCSQC